MFITGEIWSQTVYKASQCWQCYLRLWVPPVNYAVDIVVRVSGWRYKQLMSVNHWKAQHQETVKGFIIPPYAVYMYKYIQSCTKVQIPCVLLSCMTCDIRLLTLFNLSIDQTIDVFLMPMWIYGQLSHICLPQGERIPHLFLSISLPSVYRLKNIFCYLVLNKIDSIIKYTNVI